MQIVLHAGAQFTDEGKLLNSLNKNQDLLVRQGIITPPPSSYRRQIRDTLGQMKKSKMATDFKGAVMSGMIGDARPERLILSNENLFGIPRLAIKDGKFFPNAPDRLRSLSSLFYGEELELFLAIRNPASFLPALVKASSKHSIEDLTENCDPANLRWSELILSLREAVPHVPITVWCNEDTPLIWEELLRSLAALDKNTDIAGHLDLLHSIMTAEGISRLEAFLTDNPGMTEQQKRRIYSAFLDKFALKQEIEEVLDLPGWTSGMVDSMSKTYEEDVFRIEQIPGVTLIQP